MGSFEMDVDPSAIIADALVLETPAVRFRCRLILFSILRNIVPHQLTDIFYRQGTTAAPTWNFRDYQVLKGMKDTYLLKLTRIYLSQYSPLSPDQGIVQNWLLVNITNRPGGHQSRQLEDLASAFLKGFADNVSTISRFSESHFDKPQVIHQFSLRGCASLADRKSSTISQYLVWNL
tara:strand:+ start:1949 stop:2479 length:531 start_codon:yes stop_codon:yes gene_type:complete